MRKGLNSQERLRALDTALETLERRPASPKVRPFRAPRTQIKLGPKTELTIRWMKWGFRLYWVLWVALVFVKNPPSGFGDFMIIPISALGMWLIFQGHRFLLIAAVHKLSRTP